MTQCPPITDTMGGSSSRFRAPLAREIILRQLLLAFFYVQRYLPALSLSLSLFSSPFSFSLAVLIFIFRRFFCQLIYTHVPFDR